MMLNALSMKHDAQCIKCMMSIDQIWKFGIEPIAKHMIRHARRMVVVKGRWSVSGRAYEMGKAIACDSCDESSTCN